MLRGILPERELGGHFLRVVERGRGRKFSPEHNGRWVEEAGPVIEAFFHAKMMLEQAVRCGREIERLPVRFICPAWRTLCGLYGLF